MHCHRQELLFQDSPPFQGGTHTWLCSQHWLHLSQHLPTAAPCTPQLLWEHPSFHRESTSHGCLLSRADAALALPSPARAGSEDTLSCFLSLPTLSVTFHCHYTGKTSIASQLEKGKSNNRVWTLSYLSNCPPVRWLWEFCHSSAPPPGPPSARMHTALSLWHICKCWRGRSFGEAFRSQILFLNALIKLWKQLPSMDLSLLIRGASAVPRQYTAGGDGSRGTARVLPVVKTRYTITQSELETVIADLKE